MTDSMLIDISALDTLRQILGDDVNDLLEEYCRITPGLFEELVNASASGNAENMVSVAHQLKGMSANLHITGLAALFRSVELRGKNGDIDGIDIVISDGRQTLTDTINLINEMLKA
ncbi:MAG: Hpt domain-containing protein [Gammaproteobacteria bacterium]|nr:Hpt domain-containing protein [Gammaproteobacteria bacterium]